MEASDGIVRRLRLSARQIALALALTLAAMAFAMTAVRHSAVVVNPVANTDTKTQTR